MLRELSLDEMRMVSGGNQPEPPDPIDEIIVEGTRITSQVYDSVYDWLQENKKYNDLNRAALVGGGALVGGRAGAGEGLAGGILGEAAADATVDLQIQITASQIAIVAGVLATGGATFKSFARNPRNFTRSLGARVTQYE